jgi:hypothetical protein
VVLGVCTWGLAAAAIASPPGKGLTHWGTDEQQNSRAPVQHHVPLDLHLPAAGAQMQQTSAMFPSAIHHPSLETQEPTLLPALGANLQQSRVPSHAEELARRFHREGLPLARLWENKSALVSLGLNPRGKPGLWVVQKIP